MASRQVRKLLQQQQEAQLAQAAVDDSEEEEPVAKAKPFNPFDLLDDDDEAGAQQDEEEEEEAEEELSKPEPQQQKKPQPAQGSSKSKSKKNKKKGKGKGGAAQAAAGSDDEEEVGSSRKPEDDVDIDKLVQELNLTTVGPSSAGEQAGGKEGPPPLLGVEPKALRGDDELRRIFGSAVIQSVDAEERAADRRRAGLGPGGRGRPGGRAGRTLKKGLLVVPKDHWPPFDGGLSMECMGVKAGVRQFKYVWSPNYRATQRAFEQCQATYDPNAIAALLQQAPYHVDSLLAMYDLYRHLGENQYAEEVLARALYCLEMGWHHTFDVRTANCRLDFEADENRGLFLALFRHVQALSRAGCHRTALECCKLLLALEPEDPLGASCLVDYLALRAGAYEWLRAFVGGFEADSSLALRPNFSYALALAAFRLEQQQQGKQGQASDRAASGAAASTSGSGGHGQSALQLLVHAVLLHPSVVPKVLAKLQEKGSGRESHWQALLKRPLFARPHDAASLSLQHLSAIYVERSSQLWKPPDALELLRAAASAAADIAEGKPAPGGSKDGALGGGLSAEDWACVRRESFPDGGANEFRHLSLADFSDNVNALPREELQGAVAPPGAGPARGAGPGGPLPGMGALPAGLDEEALADLQQQILLAQQERGVQGAPAMSEEELRGQHPLMVLLRSLLPWVNAGQQPEYGADEGEGQGGQGQGQG